MNNPLNLSAEEIAELNEAALVILDAKEYKFNAPINQEQVQKTETQVRAFNGGFYYV